MVDARVGLHSDPAHAAHDLPGHPERPDRIHAIQAELERTGLLGRLQPLAERTATDAELSLVHHPRLADALRRLEAAGGAQIDYDTAVLPGSVPAAARAVGGALNAVDAVLTGELDAAFSLNRPPGHHATGTQSMGFCLFNQVAVAARYARVTHGVERVAILDIDVHHGNGTQAIFEDDPAVLYCSTHEYPFYPGTGHFRETGVGNLLNVPLPAGSGDAEYAATFEALIAPRVRAFRPQLVLVSAGYDAHVADPLADMALTDAGYSHIAGVIQGLAAECADGRAVWVLEGGYRLEALARAVTATLRVLLGEPPQPASSAPVRSDVVRLLAEIRALGIVPD